MKRMLVVAALLWLAVLAALGVARAEELAWAGKVVGKADGEGKVVYKAGTVSFLMRAGR
jgi:hypothetical protein